MLKYVISRDGVLDTALKSVPFVHATGNIAISVVAEGNPNKDFSSSDSAKIAVVQAVHKPLARKAKQKLHAL